MKDVCKHRLCNGNRNVLSVLCLNTVIQERKRVRTIRTPKTRIMSGNHQMKGLYSKNAVANKKRQMFSSWRCFFKRMFFQ